MKAVCWHGTNDVRVDTVPDLTISSLIGCGQLRLGQMYGQKYMPMLIDCIQKSEVDPSRVFSHRLPLSEALRDFETLKRKTENCIKVLLQP